jgi:hypothetical protein
MPVDYKPRGSNSGGDNSYFWAVVLPLLMLMLIIFSYRQERQRQSAQPDPSLAAYLRTGINPPR